MSRNGESLPDGVGNDLEDVKSLRVENFNYSPNSLTELRKIADKNPGLAEKIVESQTRVAKWYNISEIVGLAVAAAIALTIIAGFVLIVVHLGWWQSGAFLVLMLAVSHVTRTLLTGEWSDTSWLGNFFKKSGAPPSEDE